MWQSSFPRSTQVSSFFLHYTTPRKAQKSPRVPTGSALTGIMLFLVILGFRDGPAKQVRKLFHAVRAEPAFALRLIIPAVQILREGAEPGPTELAVFMLPRPAGIVPAIEGLVVQVVLPAGFQNVPGFCLFRPSFL